MFEVYKKCFPVKRAEDFVHDRPCVNSVTVGLKKPVKSGRGRRTVLFTQLLRIYTIVL